MRIVIAGGHGQIAQRLSRLLVARGNQPVGLIRNPDHADDLREVGAEPVVCDLEHSTVHEVARHVDGADAVVFAAGAGPSSGAERKTTMDKNGAILLADAAETAGVARYLMLSSMGADREPPGGTDPVFAAYLRAKGAADDDLTARSSLRWTIVRPGSLTDEPGTGKVRLAPHTGKGSIPRDDVAAVFAALLKAPRTAGMVLELISGERPINDEIERLLG
ncbi:SDR family oxidoreductase [Stackebrandtia soli]|uniref:SDR family oxidoreductase n=1 Tax=Stackebrandtia soli TaxID=1892856 RepID=UPI0039ED7D9D